MKRIFPLIFLSLFLFSGFSQNHKTVVYKKINSIYKIWTKVFSFPNGLLDQHLATILPGENNFDHLSRNVSKYQKDIIGMIGNPKNEKEVRFIALYCLQLQCFKKYKQSFIQIYQLFNLDKVSEDLMMSAIWQDDFSLEIIRNAQSDVDIKKIILALGENPKISKKNQSLLSEILFKPDFYFSHKQDLAEVGERPFDCK